VSRIARLLNASADVYRDVRTPDGMGGFTTVWTNIATVPARFAQSTAIERVLGGQSGESQTHTVYLIPGTDVQRGDRLHRGSDEFLVLSVSEPSMPGTYLAASCLFRQAGQ
jgi:head-tail adaptor